LAKLVVAKTFLNLPEALVAKSVLEAHGFVAVLLDWQVNSIAWHYMFAWRGVRLCTLDVSLPDAITLLGETEAEDPDLITTARLGDAIISFLIFWFAHIPYPVRRKRYRNSAS
jgi:hypothetical protein